MALYIHDEHDDSGGEYRLVKYGVRHYAHPLCLATNRGTASRDLVPEHQRRFWDAAVANANDWAKAFIATEDQKRRELERRLAGEQEDA